jgi:ssDNA-binding Zn-finger/Zn-ribbon topoisomerase 1
MTKDMKTEDAAKINVEDMAKVDGGFESFQDDPGSRECPNCKTICWSISKSARRGTIEAEYVCQKCGCKFHTWNTNPAEYVIDYRP